MHHALTYRRGGYVSDFTRFIDGYLQAHPEVQASQRRGWRIFWERPVNFDAWRRAGNDSVPEPPYHYD
ncbi:MULTISPECIES: DUF3460 family protein [unclassified Janthinobacterium]|uniref:DUF3460 family protein n=1 Tax=unclassified Janthinobacterium TaxID=2610881 RepID=UPI0008F51ED2|nr:MULTISPECIES: DUF3460 family protein [unclassified Janthinobacterium]APA68939.1 hypothetical protein YQ44_15295 [Janthinobacterium sp. 1_2014MBL_MicDiv]MDN2710806.1 DUF3460 family protein [Janthinobacterium sp. SUN118]